MKKKKKGYENRDGHGQGNGNEDYGHKRVGNCFSLRERGREQEGEWKRRELLNDIEQNILNYGYE